MNEKKSIVSHQGWENYYSSSSKIAWKDAPEEFLIENLELLTINKGPLKVLDIACGDGRNAQCWLATGNCLCCNDISETALKRLKKLSGSNNVIFLYGDFIQLPLLSDQFDIVQCFDGLPQMPDAYSVVNKMIELTKPGGFVLFNVFTPNDGAFGEGEQISENSFVYKDTLFSFFTVEQVRTWLPKNVKMIKYEVRKWHDPPHGDFRPYPHEHEAIFIIIQK